MDALRELDVEGIAIEPGDPQVAPLMPRLIRRRRPNGDPLVELLPVPVDPRSVQHEPFSAQLRNPIGGLAVVDQRAGLAEDPLELHPHGRFSWHA
jgi:hypothetical protein